MIFFSHSSRIRILQLTFALVSSCSEGLLTTEKHHLVPSLHVEIVLKTKQPEAETSVVYDVLTRVIKKESAS